MSGKKISAEAFLEEFTRGASNLELCSRFDIGESQLRKLVDRLEREGRISDDQHNARRYNLKIRFGSEYGPRQNEHRVDLSSGLVLHCPSCGAAVRRDAEECVYCRAPLDFSLKGKVMPCPSCGQSTPGDGRFCMRCAEPIQGRIREGLELQDHACPRCPNVNLVGFTIAGFSSMSCRQCQGLFLSHDTFAALKEKASRAAISLAPIRRQEVQAVIPQPYIRCPGCKKMMNRVNFSRISGVLVDTCRDHGIWFDAGEIEKIMDFIANGGIQKAQHMEIEKEKDEMSIARLQLDKYMVHRQESYQTWRRDDVGNGVHAVDLFLNWLFK